METASSTSMVRFTVLALTTADMSLVEFRLIVFRPFKGEVMLGRIRSSTPQGINCRLLDRPLSSK
jgi:DNA-directed RNA polymerase subunit E'/Rpb7